MKRYILTALMSLLLFAGTAFAAAPALQPKSKEKSQVEKLMQGVARIKSDQIDYAYISTAMFRQMFAMVGTDITTEGITIPFGSIRYLRRFATTGMNGYRVLAEAMQPFLQEDENVMGLELMALNREEGNTSVIYSDKDCVLVIQDSHNDELSVVFIVGLTYEVFIQMSEGGIMFDF